LKGSRLSGSSFLRRLSFSQHRDDEMALIGQSPEEPSGHPDTMAESEMKSQPTQARRLGDSSQQASNVSPAL